MIQELQLFPDSEWELPEPPAPPKPRPRGGSQNPIVFHDYDSYVAKFRDKLHAKTTDDTYTPRDVYEAVVRYVDGHLCPLEGRQLLRPFYPGGDYQRADYPEDGVVVDNPPFSRFMEIVRWYSQRRIPFFLFGPGMTIGGVTACCTAVITGVAVTFANGAVIRINFATNLLPHEVVITTAHQLKKDIEACPSQHRPPMLPKYRYPAHLLSVSLLSQIAQGDEDVCFTRRETALVRKLDGKPDGKKVFYGDHWLMSDAAAERAREAAERARETAERARETNVTLSEREREIVRRLGEPG